MRPFTGPSSFLSRSKQPRPLGQDRGYALLVLMMLATILLISLTAAMPSIYTAGQREREEELIFRGNEYARAIALFRRRFNRFPASVNELLRTNGIRFLRRAYPDPISRSGKWRFIHANVNGALIDSRTMTPQSQPGSAQAMGPSTGGTVEKGRPLAPVSATGEMQGAYIAGVASSNRRESIRVWNGHTHYDEWEFMGIEVNAPVSQPASTGQPGGPPQQGPVIPTMPPLTETGVPKP